MNDETPEWNLPKEISELYDLKLNIRKEKKKLEEAEKKIDIALQDYEQMYLTYFSQIMGLDKAYRRTPKFELALRKGKETIGYKLPVTKFLDTLVSFVVNNKSKTQKDIRILAKPIFLKRGFLPGKIIFKTEFKNLKKHQDKDSVEFKFKKNNL